LDVTPTTPTHTASVDVLDVHRDPPSEVDQEHGLTSDADGCHLVDRAVRLDAIPRQTVRGPRVVIDTSTNLIVQVQPNDPNRPYRFAAVVAH